MKFQQAQDIAHLIYRRILGTITAEEIETLDTWRKVTPANEMLYRKMLDTTFLEREYKRIKTVDIARPLADMQTRLGHKSRSMGPYRWYRIGVAVAVSGLIFWGILYLRPQPLLTEQQKTELYAAQIQPGQTQASLVLDNGVVVNLGDNQEENQNVIAHSRKTPPAKSLPRERFYHLNTPRGGEFKITLEDGTEVWLNAESQLSYPDTFRADERRVILKGEAYFKVAENKQKPFYVESDGQLIKVYGTEFNIRSYEEDPDVYTTLVSGSVSLQPTNNSQSEMLLAPGYQSVFDKNNASTSICRVDTAVVTSWRKGMFVFENQTLEQIMQTLSRWYNFSYEYQDLTLRTTLFMGSVPRYGHFNDVLEILEKSGGLKFRMKDRTVIISLL